MMSKIIAVLLGLCYYKAKSQITKFSILTILLGSFGWFPYRGYDLWFHKLSFGTFTGITKQTVKAPMKFEDREHKIIESDQFAGKFVVLDFWYSSCASCFMQFPEVQKTYEKYKENPDVEIYSIFCRMTNRLGETVETGFSLLEKAGFTFPTLSIDIEDPDFMEMGIYSFPTVIIFAPSGNIIFRGNIKNAQKYLSKLIAVPMN
ncbi:MAG: TlpA family protein disulfide reductase [Rikenellaceae bacterium]|nr:TlpA family protein disulfide reductase [Rikenellaceae bacterium]